MSEALVDAAEGELQVARPQSGIRSIIGAATGPLVRAALAAGGALLGAQALLKPHERRLTLTVEEAAQRLGISRALAYEAVRRDEIPHIKIGRPILVPITALDKLLGSASPAEERDSVDE